MNTDLRDACTSKSLHEVLLLKECSGFDASETKLVLGDVFVEGFDLLGEIHRGFFGSSAFLV